ncbi:MAG: pyridoxamine 5'-phosphate oxidase [Arenimonas sp.]
MADPQPAGVLDERILATFLALLAEARASKDPEPTAMTLATVGAQGQPSARTVLLKDVDARGFVFYTNHDSRKGRQLAVEPRAALLFHWKWLRDGVQVKIEGRAETVSDAEADLYFDSRPRASQAGAWASLQSQTLASREVLEERLREVELRFAGQPITRPQNWSGFRIVPSLVEFWYGARHRLHERRRHELLDGHWQERMLYP